MFRIGLKFPCNGLNRVRKHGYSRLYLTARYYETRARVKCETDGRLCKDVKLTSRLSGSRSYSSSHKSEKPRRAGALLTLGTVTIGTIGILVFAKNNPQFRATLEEWVPGTDKFIRIIFEDESSYFDFIRSFFKTLKETISNLVMGDGTQKNAAAPKPAFAPLIKEKPAPVNDPYAEIRLIKEKDEKPEIVVEKPVPPPEQVPKELTPTSLVELEKHCGQTAAEAIEEYRKAICAIQDYNNDVIRVIEQTGDTDRSIWNRLKESTDKTKTALEDAEKHASMMLDSLKNMYNRIDDPKLEAPGHMKTAARRNIRNLLDDVDDARKKFQQEQQNANITERYWNKIKAARESFNEELEILFPNINIHDKKFSVNEEVFDLFVLYMYNKKNNLQRELEKLKTISETKIKSALRASGEDTSQEKLDALICIEVEKQKHLLQEEFNKKFLAEQKKFTDHLQTQLKVQLNIYNDNLREALAAKEQEAERKLNRIMSERSEVESIAYKSQLASLIGRFRGMETAFKAREKEVELTLNAQVLWAACQALARAVKAAPPGAPIDRAVRPLEPEIKAVSMAAPKEDPLVTAVIRGIPEEAAKRGVFPENALRERFLKVESVASKLALVPEQGASLYVYFLSYLQSCLIVKNPNPLSKSELEDEPIDVKSLNTFDILDRARYWLDRGDFKMTLRYMNLLKGAPRSIAREWMNETRILLETQQAIDTLLAYAGAAGLIFLDPDKSGKPTQK